MPEIYRNLGSIQNNYDSSDDRSSISSRIKNTASHHTIRRYHVNVGRAEEPQFSSSSSHLQEIPRSEQFMPQSGLRKTTKSPAFQIGRDRAQSRGHLQEKSHEYEYLDFQEKTYYKPWESTRDFHQKTTLKEKHASFLDPTEIQKNQSDNHSYHNRSGSAPKPINIRQGALKPCLVNTERALVSSSLPTNLKGPDEHLGLSIVPRGRYKGESFSDLDDSNHEYVVRDKFHRSERSKDRSSSHFRKDLVGGLLTGVGVTAMLVNNQEKSRDKSEHHTRNLLGGAALGVVSAEVVSRARNLYHDHHDNRPHTKSATERNELSNVKPALGIAATGLAVAAATQFAQSRKANNEDSSRGRSRTRSRSRSCSRQDSVKDSRPTRQTSQNKHRDPEHRASVVAKAGVAAAALTGAVQHIRNRSRSRSQSRIRKGTEIMSSGLVGAAAADIYERHKEKKEIKAEEKNIEREHRERSRYRSRSTARTGSRTRYSNSENESSEKNYAREHRERSRYSNRSRERAGSRSRYSNSDSDSDEKNRGREHYERIRYNSKSRVRAESKTRNSISSSDSDEREHRKQHREIRKHRSISRARARFINAHPELDIESELEMVEYGSDPVYAKTAPLMRNTKYDHDTGAYRTGQTQGSSHRRRNSSSYHTLHSGTLSHTQIKDSANGTIGSMTAMMGTNKQNSTSGCDVVRNDNTRRYDENYSRSHRSSSVSSSIRNTIAKGLTNFFK